MVMSHRRNGTDEFLDPLIPLVNQNAFRAPKGWRVSRYRTRTIHY